MAIWNKNLSLTFFVVALALPAFAADSAAPLVTKVFLPPRLHMGDTGINPAQPIDDAAWIWHPDLRIWPTPRTPSISPPAGASRCCCASARTSSHRRTAALHVSARRTLRIVPRRPAHRSRAGPLGCGALELRHLRFPTCGRATTALKRWPGASAPMRPVAQFSWRGGFVLKAEGSYDRQLTTGKAAWEVAKLGGHRFQRRASSSSGAQLDRPRLRPAMEGRRRMCRPTSSARRSSEEPLRRERRRLETVPHHACPTNSTAKSTPGGRWPWAAARSRAKTCCAPSRRSIPICPRWQALMAGQGEMVVPPHSEQFLLWDLEQLLTAPIRCAKSAAGRARSWPGAGPNPSICPTRRPRATATSSSAKTFRGMTDTFLPEGGEHQKFSTLWWRAGRWCLLVHQDRPPSR